MAAKLLKNKTFVKLDTKELTQLFDGKKFDAKAMIAAQAKEANDYALQQQQQVNDPSLSKYKDWTIKTATDHRKLAVHAEVANRPATLACAC